MRAIFTSQRRGTVSSSGGSRGGASVTQGTAAAKPASPTPGQLYFATDTGEWWVGNTAGNAWQNLKSTSVGWTSAGITFGGGPAYNISRDGGNGWTLSNNDTEVVSQIGAGGGMAVRSAGAGLLVKEGSNCKQGTATLVAGTVTVANTSVTASSRILVTSNVDGGTPGFLRVSSRVAGTSFTVTSSSGTDTSTFAYEIFEPG